MIWGTAPYGRQPFSAPQARGGSASTAITADNTASVEWRNTAQRDGTPVVEWAGTSTAIVSDDRAAVEWQATSPIGVTSLTGNDPPQWAVFQRNAGTTTRNLPVSFSYVGTPGTLQGRVTSGATVILDWTTLSGVVTSLGTGTGILPLVPQGAAGQWYTLHLRDSTSGVTWDGSSTWAVGVIVIFSGHSIMDRTLGNNTSSGDAASITDYNGHGSNPLFVCFNNWGWQKCFTTPPHSITALGQPGTTATAGILSMGRLMATRLGVPIGIVPFSRDGTNSNQWLSPSGSLYTTTFGASGDAISSAAGFASSIYATVNGPSASGNTGLTDFEIFFWEMGENEGFDSVAQYKTALGNVYTMVTAWCSPYRTTSQFLFATNIQVNIDPVLNYAPFIENNRQATIEWVAGQKAAGKAVTIFTTTDLPRGPGSSNDGVDGVHPGSYASMRICQRLVQTALWWWGLATYPGRGPTVTSGTVNNNIITMALNGDGGTGFATANAGSPTGWYVSSDNFATGYGPGTGNYLTPSSAALSGSTVTLTMPSAPVGNTYVKYLGGTPNNNGSTAIYDSQSPPTYYQGFHNASENPDIQGAIYDNTTLPTDTLLTSFLASLAGSISTNGPTVSDGLPLQPSDGSILLGVGTAIVANGAGVVEWTGTALTSITSDRPASVEWRASFRTEAASTLEWSGTGGPITVNLADCRGQAEWLPTIITASPPVGPILFFQIGATYQVTQDLPEPLEWYGTGGTQAVTRDADAVLEWRQISATTVTVDVQAEVEWSGSGVSPATLPAYGVKNASDSPATSPWHQAPFFFGPGAIPAGSYPAITLADGVTPVSNYQWREISTRADGSWRYAVARFKADGSYDPYGGGADTNTFKFVPTTGAIPWTSTAINASTIAARSAIYVKLYGADYAADLSGPSDYYYADLNQILASKPAWPSWGLYPTGGYLLIGQGRASVKYFAWACAKRHSDDAISRWLVIGFEVEQFATGEIEVTPIVLQPWTYGPHPAGTVGPSATGQPNYPHPAQPRYAGFMECWDRTSNTMLGAWGGPNEPRQFVIPAANFNTTTNVLTTSTAIKSWSNLVGGAFPSSVGVMFAPDPATPGSTLPSGIDPNWVYWIAIDGSGAANTYLCRERSHTAPIASSNGPGAGTQWAASHSDNVGQFIAVNNVFLQAATTGTSGTVAPVPNNPPVNSTIGGSDGTMQWYQATAKFGTAGSGNVRIIPVAATFANTAVALLDKLAQPLWLDPINHTQRTWTLGMPDFDYLTTQSQGVPPFEYHAPLPIPDGPMPSSIGGLGGNVAVETYIPNRIATYYDQGTWDVERGPGDRWFDDRIGAWNMLTTRMLYNPGDRNAVRDARGKAAWFLSYTHITWDERTGMPPIVNLGHDRNGSDYPGFPTGTVNTSMYWTVFGNSGSGGNLSVGSPVPMGVGFDITIFGDRRFRHNTGYQYTYGQVANGSHLPNPATGPRAICGDYIWLMSMQCNYVACLTAYQSAGQRNVTTGFPSKLGGIVNYGYGQQRSNGWDTHRLANAYNMTPDNHPYKPVLADTVTDQGIYFANLKQFNIANEGGDWSKWAITGPQQVAAPGVNGEVTWWTLGHQLEGMAFAALCYGQEQPGYVQGVNDYLPPYAAVFDPAAGGCLFYMGLDHIFVTSDFSGSISGIFPDLATMMTHSRNTNVTNPPAQSGFLVGNNLTGQNIGGPFVCPAAGASAPQPVAVGNTSNTYPNIIDGNLNLTGGLYCSGLPVRDASDIPTINMTPLAMGSWVPGASPVIARAWVACRGRQNSGGMHGPTYVSVAPYFGQFQYAYRAKTS